MDEIEQNEWLKRVLREVKDSKSGDTITIERRSLRDGEKLRRQIQQDANVVSIKTDS